MSPVQRPASTTDARHRLEEKQVRFHATSSPTVAALTPTALTIKHPDGRDLLVFHLDGTVTGDVEDAPEAAAVMVREVKRLLGRPDAPQPRPESVVKAEALREAALAGRRATLDPGAFVKRGRDHDGDYERLDKWQERALTAAIAALDGDA